MVFYFSGTGNTEWVAKQIAKQLDDTAVNIADITSESSIKNQIISETIIGIVFPVYSWAPPKIVLDFVKHINIKKNTYTYAVCTCGDEAGYAIDILAKKICLNSGYSVIMPNNYIVLFDIDNESIIKSKIHNAKNRIKQITQNIKIRKNSFEVLKGKLPLLKSYIIAFLWDKLLRNAKRFKADDNCIGCGLCIQVCPVNIIKLKDGKPEWNNGECTQCLGCIHRCPKKAIQFGNSTKNKGRYYFK